MSDFFKKKVPTPIAILIIISVAAAILGGGFLYN